MSQRKIHFIINPAAGQAHPILHTIHQACHKYKVVWTADITQPDNVRQLTQKAVQTDADIIAVYGGDGTVTEAATELVHTSKVLGIIPGGTANVLSVELGLPQDIKKACEFICQARGAVQSLDAARMGDIYFLIRLGFGLEAEAVKGAHRSSKNRMGWLAYAFSGLQALFKARNSEYLLTLDGQERKVDGLALMVANSGNLGVPGVSLFSQVQMFDGYLDVVVISSANMKKMLAFKGQKTSEEEVFKLFQHWRAKKISVKAPAKQAIHYDGEVRYEKEVHIEVVPQALKVLTGRR